MVDDLLMQQLSSYAVQGTELSKDGTQWVDQIIEIASKAVPGIEAFKDKNVIFKSVDPEKGAAFGSLIVKAQDSFVIFPIIVKDFKLAPLDVFINKNKEFKAVTEDAVTEALFSPQATGELKDPRPHYTMSAPLDPYSDNYVGNTYATYSREITASFDFTKRLKEYMTEKDRTKLAEQLRELDGPTIVKLGHKGALAVIKELLEPPAQEKTASVNGVPSPDIFQVTRGVDGSMHVKVANSITKDRSEFVCDRAFLTKIAQTMQQQGQPGMQQAMQNPGAVVAPEGYNQGGPGNFLDLEAVKTMRPIDTPGMYRVMTMTGDPLIGMAFPTVFNFDLQPMPMNLFIGMRQMSFQEGILGALIDGSAKPTLSVISPGHTLVLVQPGAKEGQSMAFVPVQVMNMVRIGTQVLYLVMDMINQMPTALVPMKGINRIMPATPEMLGPELMVGVQGAQSVYFIPDDVAGIEFTGSVQLISSADEAIQIMQAGGPEAIAQQMQAQNQAQMQQMQQMGQQQPQQQGQPQDMMASMQGQPQQQMPQKMGSYAPRAELLRHDGKFVFRPDMRKTAGLTLDASDVAFELVCRKCRQEDVPRIIKQASADGRAVIYNLSDLTPEPVKVAAAEKEIDPLPFKKYASVNFLKLAANLPTSETVDTALALNFMTPDNLKIFAKAIPTLQQAESTLAALLVSARIGMEELPEKVIKETMENVNRIISDLKTATA